MSKLIEPTPKVKKMVSEGCLSIAGFRFAMSARSKSEQPPPIALISRVQMNSASKSGKAQ
ncbi:MAG TPA: hypothetical protein DEB24_01965 [Coriobacteriia bacterium]|nr:hypothetical protein [Coriobacteriia bacterium]